MSKSKAKGTSAETLVVNYLRSTYWSGAERRALSGGQDKGDITGTPGLCWEVKAAKTLCVPAWLRETEAERVNAGADYGILVIKPQGVGAANVREFYALMERESFRRMRDSILDDPQHCLGDRYTFGTTVRKMSLTTAAAVLAEHSKIHQWGWAHYQEFAFMNLKTMAALLVLAGYGTSDDLPG